ncbi:MAG: 1-(5-phosphoribosyl)-5-[(5-phosphoribosylamino)methylideneamino]imidazole-4-carboxamide isomerase [Dehalococcoidia bacterium]|nr:1-(5-phosphoribosyl)-5-[(5-phosphoribosylamino)methylideneamino]imidazole-4-carboxamide isomerase [Dehalococcoidia bacterium]HCV00514.1 1-(5-phosphoribosyl)-5-[(5-phosphoribosylamino)methylideneamino]imidazole-4-carboxamide isomerase [Dehalococcoidia bacterium]|tara:strand:+ start:1354 stop:2079 length:726 start_codon:yes stop_codon:yes gene_type:complete
MTLEVIPAIDIRGGRCVRLLQGDFDQETVYENDPTTVAKEWETQGAKRLHVVDLDGAKEGHPVNGVDVASICAAVTIPVEVSGGLRNIEDIEVAAAWGADRIQLGSAAVNNPELVDLAVKQFPKMIVVAIDTRGGEALTEGWLEESGADGLMLAQEMVERGAPRIMVTDVGRDGSLEGPNISLAEEFARALPVPVVASGGVTTINDLQALAKTGCEGAIVGKALYEGRFTLRKALETVATC